MPAKYGGIEGLSGPEFRRVELKTDQRSGVLTQASVLTVTSSPNRTPVVQHRKYMLEIVFGTPPPPSADLRRQMEALAHYGWQIPDRFHGFFPEREVLRRARRLASVPSRPPSAAFASQPQQ